MCFLFLVVIMCCDKASSCLCRLVKFILLIAESVQRFGLLEKRTLLGFSFNLKNWVIWFLKPKDGIYWDSVCDLKPSKYLDLNYYGSVILSVMVLSYSVQSRSGSFCLKLFVHLRVPLDLQCPKDHDLMPYWWPYSFFLQF